MKRLEFLDYLIEEIDNSPVRLTDNQKKVLVNIYSAPTPETAYESILGHQELIVSRDQLKRMQMIAVDDVSGRAGVTDSGFDMLQNTNMIDDIGELTEEGERHQLNKNPT